MKVLFIHRSVGQDLLKYGRLRELVQARGGSLDDYNNNNGRLTLDNGRESKATLIMPGNNTNPDNFAALFKQWPNLLDDYDVIAIKSCYPNSHIKDQAQLDTIKQSYEAILAACSSRHKRLVVITTSPLRPISTDPQEAKLANELADWLVTSAGGYGRVYDLHQLYANSSGKHEGMLKRQYRRLFPWDNHPNRYAHRLAGPQIAALLASLSS